MCKAHLLKQQLQSQSQGFFNDSEKDCVSS